MKHKFKKWLAFPKAFVVEAFRLFIFLPEIKKKNDRFVMKTTRKKRKTKRSFLKTIVFFKKFVF